MTNPFDLMSLPVLFVFTLVFLFIALELGYELGKIWKKRSPSTTEGAVGGVSGLTMGLLAFLLAFIVSLAAARFDTRKDLVMEDATAIRTALLRADLLTEPAQSEMKKLLSEYVDVRLNAVATGGSIAAAAERSNEILNQLWDIVIPGGANGGSESASLVIQSVNDMVNVNTHRVFVATYSRLPWTLMVAIYLVAFLSLVLVGSQSQFQGTRNLISIVVLVLVLSIVMMLIFDLDRPWEGFLQINQQPMIDLQVEMDAQGL